MLKDKLIDIWELKEKSLWKCTVQHKPKNHLLLSSTETELMICRQILPLSLSTTAEIVLQIEFKSLTAVTYQWAVHICLEAKGHWWIPFCMYDSWIIVLCLALLWCEHSWLLHWQIQIALSQTDSCCLSFVPMINALKIWPGSPHQGYVLPKLKLLHFLSVYLHVDIFLVLKNEWVWTLNHKILFTLQFS